jgi:[FeFe] hydrogenase H-cluster maturation GTPase HydF
MGLNNTPSADRLHIGFFGRRNAGKSSLVNAVTGQEISIVSEQKGTTTDPVYKAMELLPLGPVVIIDTPGIDDSGPLGELRAGRAKRVLSKTDLAVLVVDAAGGKSQTDRELIGLFKERGVNYLVAYTKSDLLSPSPGGDVPGGEEDPAVLVSARTGEGIWALKERIAALGTATEAAGDPKPRIVGDLIQRGDLVVLVVPIDKAAPKGRLILPQQQTIRDILEAGGTAVVVREFELRETLDRLGWKPKLVITDSQVFAQVAADVPQDIPLTSFSILFARYKGFLTQAVRGIAALDRLAPGDRVLIAEGCTHHRQCDDIGTVKIPQWIRNYTGVEPVFDFCSGGEFPEDPSAYKLVVHCGACMLNDREMEYRRERAGDRGVPMTNYGILIAQTQGILRRSIALFPQVLAELDPGKT